MHSLLSNSVCMLPSVISPASRWQLPSGAVSKPAACAGCQRCPSPQVTHPTAGGALRRRAAHRTLQAVASPVVGAGPAPTGAPEVAAPDGAATPAAPFLWARHWWPVVPVAYLHDDRPNAATALGIKLALWKAPGGWSALEDRCPHRLAPLTEGRVDVASGTLQCSYHGWQFDSQGACKVIPQIADPTSATAATGSKRACATAYPTREVAGLLFVWLDISAAGLAECALQEPYVPPEMTGSTFIWTVNEVPNDYTFWMEQGMDPSHSMFLHHGLGFDMKNNVAMAADRASAVDLHKGFVWRHRGYEHKNAAMVATRRFVPPAALRQEYVQASGQRSVFCTMALPVEPGVSRTFFNLAFVAPDAAAPPSSPPAAAAATAQGAAGAAAAAGGGGTSPGGSTLLAVVEPGVEPVQNASSSSGTGSSSAPVAGSPDAQAVAKSTGGGLSGPGGGLVATLMKAVTKVFKIPHYVFMLQLLGDQDIVVMHQQENLMRSRGLTSTSYSLLSPADEGVRAMNKWLKMANYRGMWAQVHAPGAVPQPRSEPLSLEALLDRRSRHVKMCKLCQQGERDVTKASTAVAALCAVCALAGVATAMSLPAEGVAAFLREHPVYILALVGWASGAVMSATAASRLLAFRYERFVSGAEEWRARGGYAGKPKK